MEEKSSGKRTCGECGHLRISLIDGKLKCDVELPAWVYSKLFWPKGASVCSQNDIQAGQCACFCVPCTIGGDNHERD